MKRASLVGAIGLIFAGVAAAQQGTPASTVPGKSILAISYQVKSGSTKVDLVPTGLNAQATGEAKVEAKEGRTSIEAQVEGMPQASTFGAEFLTYVLWSVSPEGRTSNLGELLVDKEGKAELKATTQLQVFSLIVTAEPYFAVRQPS